MRGIGGRIGVVEALDGGFVVAGLGEALMHGRAHRLEMLDAPRQDAGEGGKPGALILAEREAEAMELLALNHVALNERGLALDVGLQGGGALAQGGGLAQMLADDILTSHGGHLSGEDVVADGADVGRYGVKQGGLLIGNAPLNGPMHQQAGLHLADVEAGGGGLWRRQGLGRRATKRIHTGRSPRVAEMKRAGISERCHR